MMLDFIVNAFAEISFQLASEKSKKMGCVTGSIFLFIAIAGIFVVGLIILGGNQ